MARHPEQVRTLVAHEPPDRESAWPQRAWAFGGAGGLGHLLARQRLAAGERVLDVQPKLGAHVHGIFGAPRG